MTTVKYDKICTLCGLPVKIEGFSLAKDREVLSFCCAGCQSIYQLIYMNDPSINNKNKQTNDNNNEETS